MRSIVAPQICVVLLFSAAGAFAATTTAFTYQGQLKDNGVPLTDTRDLKFALFDAATAGNAVGTPITKSGIALSNGLFTVELDFGAGVFDGSDRFLEISHGPAGGTLTVLSPRQKLTATPYAAHAGGIDGIRIVPAAAPATDAPGILGGFSGNAITSGKKGGTIAGGGGSGQVNKVTDDYGTVGGGIFNTAAFNGFVGGGYLNSATGNQATISGGDNNVASGLFSTVPGGQSNNASGPNSFAAGTSASASNNGSFVWSDNSGTGASSSADNDFTVRAIGGVRFLTNMLDSTGVSLAAGGSAWAAICDRNKKKNFRDLDGEDVLKKLAGMTVTQWNYKWEKDSDVPNIGPMAQDFKGAFYPGRDDKTITTLEFDGVELAAIKALEARSQTKDAEIKALKTENEDMKARLEKLERLVEQLAKK